MHVIVIQWLAPSPKIVTVTYYTNLVVMNGTLIAFLLQQGWAKYGQIRPAQAFCPARGVAISTHVGENSCKNVNFCSCCLKIMAQIFFKTARGQKKLPTPVLQAIQTKS
jgi:hypothetical protein